MPGGEGRVWGERAQVVEGEFGDREKIGPTIRGKGDVGSGEDGKEVVLPCPDRPLCLVGSVVERGD